MNRLPSCARRSPGFTLTELAVVLVVVALVLGGLLSPLATQMDVRMTAETRKDLADIREALLGFAVINGRLPCPADATIASGVVGAGLEAAHDAGGNCPNGSGVVPWVTLGVAETDAWGQRFSYRVTPAYAQRVSPPRNAAFDLSTPGTLDVRSAAAGGTMVAGGLPVVFVSHGGNGRGGYNRQGAQLPTGEGEDEIDNQLTNAGTAMANTVFVSQARNPASGFDDEVGWVPRAILVSRMIGVGKLP
ncbi:prepilin-type N-terminal cleavage/methylation domain-containing protein [Accumulibacter sp.]|uniref:prepilin-type N-terminal cleavage/methylation domain-containing protein n=1 Tax=Accumulibacter sp. TaxID=2053492 RepID=UPI0025E15BF8|nr:prepilin-type N-terminal cleavage/methylation domain-containing protein [Accumulibacter sp.]MCM8613363.1 prepilin-type N-terminal cleavage/methylation domain-containing protein [Accumulibacter sp.]MCM8637010.1 prepilin-type N-terminal cleavage/methylation domain-containing protein [Accumulibacter sp.]MCM8641868.1 prepilin-type N-terminal cleavage/methylation domain-containing protein [Accumulibacter sp.]